MKLVLLTSLLLNRVVEIVDLRKYSMMKMRTMILKKLKNLLNPWVDPSQQGSEENQEAACSLLMTMMKMTNPSMVNHLVDFNHLLLQNLKSQTFWMRMTMMKDLFLKLKHQQLVLQACHLHFLKWEIREEYHCPHLPQPSQTFHPLRLRLHLKRPQHYGEVMMTKKRMKALWLRQNLRQPQ